MRKSIILFLCLSLILMPVRAAEPEKYVALTFDDGPSGRFTRALLDALAERDVKATFFLCGYRIKDDPGLTARIASEGHEIGIHGYTHSCMADMCRENIEKEIRATQNLLPENYQSVLLRPPGGKQSDAVRKAALDAGLSMVTWSVDPRDWQTSDAQAVTQRVLRNVHDGDVILLHDMSYSSVQAALAIIDKLRADGFGFVTVSQLALLHGQTLVPGEFYSHF